MILRNLIKIMAALLIFQLNYAFGLQIVTRQQWHAHKAKKPTPLQLPMPKAVIAHTASGECLDTETCLSIIRNIQDYHMGNERRFSDIGYNFLVGGDGLVYEGRGWKYQGAHTLGHNQNSICIAFIGNFEHKEPTSQQKRAAQLLLEQGLVENFLRTDYKLYGHSQLTAIKSPGTALYNIINTWPHWSPI